MKVFKFGGASIETVERVIRLEEILSKFHKEKILVVVSAKGKTTNALEAIVDHGFHGNSETALQLITALRADHVAYCHQLLGDSNKTLDLVHQCMNEMEFLLDEPREKGYDYYYDQIVCLGEVLSTTIISAYLAQRGLKIGWMDSRDLIRTNDQYRDAAIDWDTTTRLIQEKVLPGFEPYNLIMVQGFIGSTSENTSVTLGREGSDFTAAIFASVLKADSVTIWKDVPSLLNADPKIFPNTVPIPKISYHEVIEMAFYGAQVIHPKTIKPLFNQKIPLWVRCFLDSDLPGTLITDLEEVIRYPPIMVLKKNQILLEVKTKDYSFITEDNLSKIYELFYRHKIKINLIQNAAISFVACIDSVGDKLEALLHDLSESYTIKRNENLFLFTVRHYTQDVLREELKNRTVLLTQKTRQTIQIIAK